MNASGIATSAIVRNVSMRIPVFILLRPWYWWII